MSILNHDDDDDPYESMSFLGPRSGSWFISSVSDPRWNDSGRSFVGGFMMPQEAKKAIETKTELYGPPPEDLEWGYMKD